MRFYLSMMTMKFSTELLGLKKTKKDIKLGKATLISLLGYKKAVIFSEKLKIKIQKKIMKYGKQSKNLKETVNYILRRSNEQL